MKGLIGKKLFVNQVFASDGTVIPVTIVEVLPNVVTQIKTVDTDGYSALQLGAGFKKNKNLSKSVVHHLAKSKTKDKRVLSEFRGMDGYQLGDLVAIDFLQSGHFIHVQSISKGKGTSGVIKRHNFSRGPMTHGSKHHRAPGSVGLSRPDKVWKGQPLPGRKGYTKTKIRNLLIVKVNPKMNLLFVKGTFAGPLNSFCKIILNQQKKTIKGPKLVDYSNNKTSSSDINRNKDIFVTNSQSATTGVKK